MELNRTEGLCADCRKAHYCKRTCPRQLKYEQKKLYEALYKDFMEKLKLEKKEETKDDNGQ